MSTQSVSRDDRFIREHPCPICHGYQSLTPGHGERCWGYLSSDGEFIFCTNDEHGRGLEKQANGAYTHKRYGPCDCGIEHNPAHISLNGHHKKASGENAGTFTYDDSRAVARFPYYDEEQLLLYVTVRYEWPDAKSPKGYAKTCRQFHKDETTGKWIPSIDGIRRVLYGLPEHLKADPALNRYLVEGEPKVKALRALGLVALCNSMGAGKWDDEYNESLKGFHVVILPDNDKAGKDHAKQVAKSLKGEALSVRTVKLPGLAEKGDIIDWLKAGGTREQLEQFAPPLKRKFLYASEVKPEPVEYLWTKRLAKGMLTLLVGDPGLGKGLLCARLAAEVSKKGGLLPDGKALETGGVIIMSPEDSYQHTIVPRLIAAGADLSKIILLSEVPDFDSEGKPYNRPISFPEDAFILEEAIKECKASLAIIDPVLAMIDGKHDSHKDQESRAALSQVLSVAARHNCALLGIFHLNKSQSANVLYRSGASIAWIAMARIGLFLVPDPDNQENGRVLVNFKNNLTAKTTSLRFKIEEKRLEETQDTSAYVTWQGESSYSEDELLNPQHTLNNPKSEQETDLLTVLKASELAMTPGDIHKKLRTDQSIDALKMMLQRKVDQGVLMKVKRGLYTYAENLRYETEDDENKVTSEPDVTYVTNVTFSENRVPTEAEEQSNISNISNMPSESDDYEEFTL